MMQECNLNSPHLHAGHTVGHAMADVHCIMRLHMTLVRMRALMRASAQVGSTSGAGQRDSLAAPMAGAHDSAQLLQSTAETSETLEVTVKRKRSPSGAADMQEAQPKRSRHEGHIIMNGRPHDREQHNSSDRDTDHPNIIQHQTASQMWQCQHSSRVSIARAGCASCQLLVAPSTHPLQAAASPDLKQDKSNTTAAEEGATPIEDRAPALPQLRVTMQWSCENPTGPEKAATAYIGNTSGQHTTAAPVQRPRCHLSTEPRIPESATQELAAMAGTHNFGLCEALPFTTKHCSQRRTSLAGPFSGTGNLMRVLEDAPASCMGTKAEATCQ